MHIRTTPAMLWRALTTGAMTRKHDFQSTLETALRKGAELRYAIEGKPVILGKVLFR